MNGTLERPGPLSFPAMTESQDGNGPNLDPVLVEQVDALEARRLSHGMPVAQLAKRAGVGDDYLRAVLDKKRKPSPTYLGGITKALDDYEAEVGGPAGDNDLDLVEFEVTGPSAEWRLVVKGPVRDRHALEESVLRLMAARMEQE
jgi:transcriptional regulator with XRE-family HTH domain